MAREPRGGGRGSAYDVHVTKIGIEQAPIDQDG